VTANMHREAHRQRLASAWTVSTTPMDAKQAEEASRMIADRFPTVHADPVDPRAFVTLGLDRWGAETVLAGLQMVADSGGDVGVLLEVLEDFVAYGYPYQEGEEHWPGVR
jgi:hypothetical protein